MATQPKSFITADQYLEIERKAEFKSEYFGGEMFAMAGASWIHNLVLVNLLFEITRQLRPGPCFVLPSDMRVRVGPSGLYTYPDVSVVCTEPVFADDLTDTLTNPNLIVEVLSPATEAYDRGRKFEQYRTIGSLSEYVLVATDRIQADVFSRQPDGGWLLTAADGAEATLQLRSIDCRLGLASLYAKTPLRTR